MPPARSINSVILVLLVVVTCLLLLNLNHQHLGDGNGGARLDSKRRSSTFGTSVVKPHNNAADAQGLLEHVETWASDSEGQQQQSQQRQQQQEAQGGTAHVQPPKHDQRIGVLLIACNREEVTRAINSLLKYRPKDGFPIVVSQDCGDSNTAHAIDPYEDRLIHLQQPNLGPIEDLPPAHKHLVNYYKIARHFKWALSQMFDVLMFDQIIVMEDDIEVAPDFFVYFSAMLPLLQADPTLFCVSAWNDNGKLGLIDDPQRLRRTDFFPGLGWMITRKVWDELKPKWPVAFWDDWMRHFDQRLDRACIQPEISRTYTFGERGASVGQYWKEHLQFIVLNKDYVAFDKMNSTWDLLQEPYDAKFMHEVYDLAEVVQARDLNGVVKQRGDGEPVMLFRVMYDSAKSFEQYAKEFQLMSDIREGVPRSAYKGVVEFKRKGHRVFLAPPRDWEGYRSLVTR